MRNRIVLSACLAVATALPLVGCSNSKVTFKDQSDPYRDIDLTEPDFIIVEQFAVTPDDAKDKTKLGEVPGRTFDQRPKEKSFGEQFAAALQRHLVAELTAKKIRAVRAEEAPRGTWKTAIIDGYFYNDSLIGFALRNKQFDARTVFYIQQVEIGDVTADVQTRLTIDTMNAEAERIIDAEAKMMAKKIVKEIIMPAYKRRGWRM